MSEKLKGFKWMKILPIQWVPVFWEINDCLHLLVIYFCTLIKRKKLKWKKGCYVLTIERWGFLEAYHSEWWPPFLWKRDLWPHLHFKYSYSGMVKINELIVRETAWVTNFLGKERKEHKGGGQWSPPDSRAIEQKRYQLSSCSYFSKIIWG